MNLPCFSFSFHDISPHPQRGPLTFMPLYNWCLSGYFYLTSFGIISSNSIYDTSLLLFMKLSKSLLCIDGIHYLFVQLLLNILTDLISWLSKIVPQQKLIYCCLYCMKTLTLSRIYPGMPYPNPSLSTPSLFFFSQNLHADFHSLCINTNLQSCQHL